jgi:hypothetical protein
MTEEQTPETVAEIVAEATTAISPDPLDGIGKKARKKADDAPATQQYVVINGAISPNGGGRENLVHPGSVVSLTTAQAKHYNKMGYLKPYIGD